MKWGSSDHSQPTCFLQVPTDLLLKNLCMHTNQVHMKHIPNVVRKSESRAMGSYLGLDCISGHILTKVD